MLLPLYPLLLALLTAMNYKRGGWWIPAALLAAAVGDLCGVCGVFYGQLFCFAVMTLLLVADFIPYCDNRRTWGSMASTLLILLAVTIVAGAEERIPVTLYAVMVVTMVILSAFQRRAKWGWYFAATILFALSDSLLGIHRYLTPSWLLDRLWVVFYLASLAFFASLHLGRKAD